MKQKVGVILFAAAALTLAAAAPGEAWHWGWAYWHPYWHPYDGPHWYGPPVVIERQVPPTYIQRPQEQFWYWCNDPKGYYPYVQQCPAGWTRVAPNPPPPTAPR